MWFKIMAGVALAAIAILHLKMALGHDLTQAEAELLSCLMEACWR